MILVDTSIWIDHLHHSEPRLVELLEQVRVITHEAVIQELALGSLASRDVVIDSLSRLRRAPTLSHHEIMTFLEGNRLWGRGLSAIDMHLAASVRVVPGAQMWARDKRLKRACAELEIPTLAE